MKKYQVLKFACRDTSRGPYVMLYTQTIGRIIRNNVHCCRTGLDEDLEKYLSEMD